MKIFVRFMQVMVCTAPMTFFAMKEEAVPQKKTLSCGISSFSKRMSALSEEQKKKYKTYLQTTLSASDTHADALMQFSEGLSYAEGKDIFLDALEKDSAPALERAFKVGCRTITSSAYAGGSPLLIAVLLSKRSVLNVLLENIPATEEELSTYVQHAICLHDTPTACAITEFALDKRKPPLPDFIVNHGYSIGSSTGYELNHSGHLIMHALVQNDFESATKLFDRYDLRQVMGWFSVEKERGDSVALGYVFRRLGGDEYNPSALPFLEKLLKKGCKAHDVWEYGKYNANESLNLEVFFSKIIQLNSRVSQRSRYDRLNIYQPAVLKLLAKNGADINYEMKSTHSSDVWTPLLSAIAYNKKDAVECLLNLGADVNKKVSTKFDPYVPAGKTRTTSSPLSFAIQLGRKEMVELLLKRGGKI